MKRFYWFLFALILVVGRFALLAALYFFDSPTGGPLVADWNRFLWHTWFAEIGFAMALTVVLSLISLVVRGQGVKVFKIISVVLAGLYLLASGADDEVMRWMNQKLTFSFIGTYMNATADMGLVASIFMGGAFHFLLTFFLVVAGTVGVALYVRKMDFKQVWKRPRGAKPFIAFSLVILFAILGCTSHLWFNPSHRRWPRIKPVAYVLAEELLQSFETMTPPDNYREGVVALGGNPDAEFPFWKKAPNEALSLETFKSRPLEERPDIILFTIESLRGWTSDMRVPENCARFPHLCSLAQSGVYYPNAHSVGYPSIEGFLGIMAGVLSVPNGTFLYNFPNTRLRTMSDILADAGYYREVLCGADPKFDNELVWQEKWFDYNEFNAANDNDVAIARRFVELYDSRPQNKPLFFHWMSRSMHVPFTLPSDMGEAPSDMEQMYVRAEAYMDSALGIIMNHVLKGPRANSTLFVLTGDHSFPNNGQTMESMRLGKIHEGMTWVSLIFAGAGVMPRVDARPVSQGDIPLSVIGYLGLDVSNHFMGANLLADSLNLQKLPPVYSFRQGEAAMREDSLSYFVSLADNEMASVRRASFEPEWDFSHPVEGFVAGASVAEPPANLEATTSTVRAAARAWDYVVHKNMLMPSSK